MVGQVSFAERDVARSVRLTGLFRLLLCIRMNRLLLFHWSDLCTACRTHNYPNGVPVAIVLGIPLNADYTFTITGWITDPNDLVVPTIRVIIVPQTFSFLWPAFQVCNEPTRICFGLGPASTGVVMLCSTPLLMKRARPIADPRLLQSFIGCILRNRCRSKARHTLRASCQPPSHPTPSTAKPALWSKLLAAAVLRSLHQSRHLLRLHRPQVPAPHSQSLRFLLLEQRHPSLGW